MQSTTRLLIVDDDVDIAEHLRRFLAERGFDVRVAYDVPSGRAALAAHAPALCLVDIVMPGPSGKVFCAEIAARSDAGVVMMSSLSDSETIIALLEIGADDYLVKPFHLPEMLARVRAVLRRLDAGAPVRPLDRLGPWALELAERRLRHDEGFTVALTPSEMEMLRFMSASPGTVFARSDLLAASRARQHGGNDDRAIDNLVKRLRRKLETDSADPQHLVTVWGRGYRLEP
ncbi:MAG: response regulator transcription factor, partial [Pseudomonadota bacterium]